jgi:hypothetical protein
VQHLDQAFFNLLRKMIMETAAKMMTKPLAQMPAITLGCRATGESEDCESLGDAVVTNGCGEGRELAGVLLVVAGALVPASGK